MFASSGCKFCASYGCNISDVRLLTERDMRLLILHAWYVSSGCKRCAFSADELQTSSDCNRCVHLLVVRGERLLVVSVCVY